MPDVSYSLGAFSQHSIDQALDAVAEAGFSCIELAGLGTSFTDWNLVQHDDVPVPPTGPAATEFRQQIEKRGLRATTMHAPMRRNVLGAPDEAWRREKVEVLGNYMHFAAEMGAKGMVIHGIPNPMFLPQDQELSTFLEPMVDAMTRSVTELVPVAAAAGIRMLLENLPYNVDLDIELPLIRTYQLRPFVEQFPSEQVALVVDTGHAWTSGDDPARMCEIAGDRLWGTHLQDVPHENPRDNHWVPTHGGLDWDAIRATLDDIDYPGTMTFEVIHGQNDESAEELARQTRAVATGWRI